ncbi:hypothetical protein O3P69_012278 [Scylla paramamosain]|uniref:Uncharacterized protein n=1 Tax=Scylla paramamosain TaxID=85552 RepID=A0AAW0TCR8_SCYPA
MTGVTAVTSRRLVTSQAREEGTRLGRCSKKKKENEHSPSISQEGIIIVPITFPPAYVPPAPPPSGISVMESGHLFASGQVPTGVTVTTSPGGRHVIQIPPGLKWRDVKGSLTNPEARRKWREIFNVVLSLRREEEKKILNTPGNQISITPVRSGDVSVPMGITLPQIKKTIKTADLKRLKKLKKRLRKLLRQARRNQRKLLLRVPSSVGSPPPGISVISSSGGEQVIQIPNTVKWSEVRGSFPSAAEREVWRQIFQSRDSNTKMIRESVEKVLAGNWLVTDEIENRVAQIRTKNKWTVEWLSD